MDARHVVVDIPQDGDGRILITYSREHTSIRRLSDDEHIASFNALIDLANLAGYKIVTMDGNAL